MPESHQSFQRRTWVRRAIPASAVAVLVVAGTITVHTNASASPIDTYRTTTVTKGPVEQRLDLTGSVQRVNQVSQGFAVPGTVSNVSVAVGDTVRAGETLATLDPKPLNGAVTSAEAALAKAKATLESDQNSATTATTSGSSTSGAQSTASAQTAASTAASHTTSPSGRTGTGTDRSLARAQQRAATAQNTFAADLARASAALTRCAQFMPTDSSTPTPTRTPVPAPPTSATSSPTTSGTAGATTSPASSTTAQPTPAALKACIGALKMAPSQQHIQRDQQTLTRSQTDLTKAYTLAITTSGKEATAAATTTRSGSASQSAASQSTSQSAGAGTGNTGQSSAARVVSDQAAVTSAEEELRSAQVDLASSTLKSSITGTVGSVGFVKGTASEGASIDIVGAGAVKVTVNVPLASMTSVHVGQKASVAPRGATASSPGAVTSISLLPSTTSTGTGTATAQATTAAITPTYPVVVLVPDAQSALASGSQAAVSLLIGTADHVLTVPNSALTPLGNGQALALTLKNGVATRTLVKTGYAGTLTTQVISGLTAGQKVVLADLSAPLPTNTTSSRRFGVGGGSAGGLGGAGLGGAGVGGGRTGFSTSG